MASASQSPKQGASVPTFNKVGHSRSSSRSTDPNTFAARFEDETKTPDIDISSSDPDDKPEKKSKSRARAKKERKISHATQESLPSLRPAKDILSRIRHDPKLREKDFIVGYMDRHEPEPLEMPVSDWKGGEDMMEEDWIPQHRILYFRRRDEPKTSRVWDRELRLDMLFNSGVPHNVYLRSREKPLS